MLGFDCLSGVYEAQRMEIMTLKNSLAARTSELAVEREMRRGDQLQIHRIAAERDDAKRNLLMVTSDLQTLRRDYMLKSAGAAGTHALWVRTVRERDFAQKRAAELGKQLGLDWSQPHNGAMHASAFDLALDDRIRSLEREMHIVRGRTLP